MSEVADVPSPSDRTRLRRGADKGHYDRETVLAILRQGLIANVGVTTPDGPVVIPTAYGHDHNRLYLHGAVGNAALRAAIGAPVCVTVTVVEGLLIGRSPFHNSMRYRSVMVRGNVSTLDDEDERRAAMARIADHVVANWGTGRPPTDAEFRRTLVVALDLTESSAKIRTGDPTDEPGDTDTDHWAGAIPLVARWGEAEPAANLADGIAPPSAVAALSGRAVFAEP